MPGNDSACFTISSADGAARVELRVAEVGTPSALVLWPLVIDDDGRLMLELSGTAWDCHECCAHESGDGFTLCLHHAMDAQHEVRLMVWASGQASLTDFAGAQAVGVIKRAMRERDAELMGARVVGEHVTRDDAEAGTPVSVDAALSGGAARFRVVTDEYVLASGPISRATIVDQQRHRDIHLTAGMMWDTRVVERGGGVFGVTMTREQPERLTLHVLMDAAGDRALVDGAAEAIASSALHHALVAYEQRRDLASLLAALGLPTADALAAMSPAGPGSPGAHWYRLDRAQCEVGPNQWADAPIITDRLTGEVLLDLSNTNWDGLVTLSPDHVATVGLRCYPDGGTAYLATMDLDARTARVDDGPRIPLAWLNRCLRAFSMYERHDVLRTLLSHQPPGPGQPDVRMRAGGGAIVELWRHATDTAQLPLMTLHLRDARGRTLLDLRPSGWAAEIHGSSPESGLIGVQLVHPTDRDRYPLFVEHLYVDVRARRVRARTMKGCVALCRFAALLMQFPMPREAVAAIVEAMGAGVGPGSEEREE